RREAETPEAGSLPSASGESGDDGFRRSHGRALSDLLTGHDVRKALRVSDLGRRGVSRTPQVAVDRVRHELVPVRVGKHVVIQGHGAAHLIADEAEPETVVADDARAAVDDVVLDGGERDVERATEGTGSAADVDPAVDRREVDLDGRRVRGADAAADRSGRDASLVAAELERG